MGEGAKPLGSINSNTSNAPLAINNRALFGPRSDSLSSKYATISSVTLVHSVFKQREVVAPLAKLQLVLEWSEKA